MRGLWTRGRPVEQAGGGRRVVPAHGRRKKTDDCFSAAGDFRGESDRLPHTSSPLSTPVGYSTQAFSAASASAPLVKPVIGRRQLPESDVQIQILDCGVCHSDLPFARNEWRFTQDPAAPATKSWAA